MRGANVAYHRGIWLGYPTKIANFTGMIHAHFQNDEFSVFGNAKQG